jgi:hypothetical protein
MPRADTVGRSSTRPAAAKAECLHSSFGVPDQDPGIEQAVGQSLTWLSQAQNRLTSVAAEACRSIVDTGWETSYLKVTGSSPRRCSPMPE